MVALCFVFFFFFFFFFVVVVVVAVVVVVVVVLLPFQDHFSSYEMGQSVGGTKTGGSKEKTPGTPHTCDELGDYSFISGRFVKM